MAIIKKIASEAYVDEYVATAVEHSVLYTEQPLTDEQKAQARWNIGAVSETEVATMINNALGVIENGTY